MNSEFHVGKSFSTYSYLYSTRFDNIEIFLAEIWNFELERRYLLSKYKFRQKGFERKLSSLFFTVINLLLYKKSLQLPYPIRDKISNEKQKTERLKLQVVKNAIIFQMPVSFWSTWPPLSPGRPVVITIFSNVSVRTSVCPSVPTFQSLEEQTSSENNDHCWWDNGSGRGDHWWRTSFFSLIYSKHVRSSIKMKN